MYIKYTPLLMVLSACAETPKVSAERLAAVQQASSEESMKSCKFLGRFVGASTLPGERGLDQAREEARAKAVSVPAATHFLIASESPTPDVTTVAAQAYDCSGEK